VKSFEFVSQKGLFLFLFSLFLFVPNQEFTSQKKVKRKGKEKVESCEIMCVRLRVCVLEVMEASPPPIVCP
jgi:hypothetical protein